MWHAEDDRLAVVLQTRRRRLLASERFELGMRGPVCVADRRNVVQQPLSLATQASHAPPVGRGRPTGANLRQEDWEYYERI